MKSQRAQEIIDSKETINVLYDGTKVFIQNVNEVEFVKKQGFMWDIFLEFSNDDGEVATILKQSKM